MCLGGHLAFRAAFDKRIKAAVCYFATDIHSHTLGKGKNDDSLDRVKDISGELIMVCAVPFIPLQLIRSHHSHRGCFQTNSTSPNPP